MKMSKRMKLAAAGGTLVVAGFAGGAAVAVTGAASAVGDAVTSSSSRPDGHADEELLTGTTAERVTAAVEAEYPDATIERVETDSDGVYEAHIVTSDGEELVVQVGDDFEITGTQTGGHGPHGRGGPHEEPLTGATADRVTAAVEAEYPDATIERVETDSEGVYEAHIVTSDGEGLIVQVGDDFEITGTQTGGHGPHGRGGPHEEPLTGATADRVTAAVEAEYPDATIERVETDSEGVYEAHIVTSDGEELVVQVGEDFEITGTQADDHGGHGDDDV